MPFKYPTLTFQYISHRVLRWTITPFLMILVLLLNLLLVWQEPAGIFLFLLVAQVVFYLSAYLGKLMEARKLRVKILFVPYYFCVMNYAVLAGQIRYFFSGQSVIWEKAIRK